MNTDDHLARIKSTLNWIILNGYEKIWVNGKLDAWKCKRCSAICPDQSSMNHFSPCETRKAEVLLHDLFPQTTPEKIRENSWAELDRAAERLSNFRAGAPSPKSATEYQILAAGQLEDLQIQVRQFIKNGWTPLGGISASGIPHYVQAMIRDHPQKTQIT